MKTKVGDWDYDPNAYIPSETKEEDLAEDNTKAISELSAPIISSVATMGVSVNGLFNAFLDAMQVYDIKAKVWTDMYAIPANSVAGATLAIYKSVDGGNAWSSIGTIPLDGPAGDRILKMGVVWNDGNPMILVLKYNTGSSTSNAILVYDVATLTLQSTQAIGSRTVLSFRQSMESTGPYVFIAEYDPGLTTGTCKLWRYSCTGKTWTDQTANVPNASTIRHFHAIQGDPYNWNTGLWLCSGDDNALCHIWFSADFGATWTDMGNGSQEFRTIGFVFDASYIYWGMDFGSSAAQAKIFRAPRTDLSARAMIAHSDNDLAIYSLCHTFYPNGFLVFTRHEPTSKDATEINVEFYNFADGTLKVVGAFPSHGLAQSNYFGFTASSRYIDMAHGTLLATFGGLNDTDYYKPYGATANGALRLTLSMGR